MPTAGPLPVYSPDDSSNDRQTHMVAFHDRKTVVGGLPARNCVYAIFLQHGVLMIRVPQAASGLRIVTSSTAPGRRASR